MASEALLQQQVCDYIRYQYPNVMFRSDFASGMKMTMGQAVKHKRLQSGRAWPDLFIPEARYSKQDHEMYSGLFIELKAVPIYKRDGTLKKDDHLFEQETCLRELRRRGYAAYFAVGFDEAVDIIDNYLSPK